MTEPSTLHLSTIVYVVGARPNLVKMAPVFHELRRRLPQVHHVLVHTGQHYDREMSEVFLADLQLPEPHHSLKVGSGSHGTQTARALARLERVFEEHDPDLVLVAGDVNSTLAGALAAAKLEIPIAHVEAGLRSFDRSMPEEINRLLVDQLSTWCFTHSPEALVNLEREGIVRERVFFVGNTMIDSLERLRPRFDLSEVHERLSLPRGGYILATLHRPRLTDGPLLRPVIANLGVLSETLPVVFPMHPRTRARLHADQPAGPGLRILDPVGYVDFLALEAGAAGVITDSGGVQEETTYLGIPCFTLRDNTERPVTIHRGTNRLLGLDPSAIPSIPALLSKFPSSPKPLPDGWDGQAARRLAEVLAGAAPWRTDLSPGAARVRASAR